MGQAQGLPTGRGAACVRWLQGRHAGYLPGFWWIVEVGWGLAHR